MNYGLVLATVELIAGGLIIILGLIILRDQPRNPLNRLVAFMLFFAGLGATLGSSEFLLPQINPKLGEEGIYLVSEFSFLWELFFPMLLLFALTFPRPQPSVRRFPIIKVLIFVPHIGHMILVGAHTFLGDDFGIPADAGVLWTLPRIVVSVLYGFHRTLFSLVNLAYVVASLVVIARSAGGDSRLNLRQQMVAISWGMGLCAVLYFVSAPGMNLFFSEGSVVLRHTILLLALVVGCGSIAFAMVRFRFLEVSLLVRRAILYAISTALLVGLYLTVVQKLDALIRQVTGIETPVFEGLVLVVSLVLFQPLLAKLEETLERVLLQERTDYRSAIRNLSERMVARLDVQDLGREVVRALHDCLLTDRVALIRYAPGEEHATLVAAEGLGDDTAAFLAELLSRGEAQDCEPLSPIATSVGSFFLIPLRHENVTIGAVILGQKFTGGRYNREDHTLLAAVANQVSVALRNAELHEASLRQAELERDLDTARRIQQGFLPSRFPHRGGIDIFGDNVPSREVGGDYFDVLEQGGHAMLLAVADVSGKGVPAALLASMLQASLRTQVSTENRVGRIVQRLNSLVYESTTPDQFATFFLGRIDLARMRFTYANAGHNFPILLREPGAVFLDHSDLILGLAPGVHYKEVSVDLEPGDRLVLFTDGISEAYVITPSRPDPAQLGEDGLVTLLREMGNDLTASGMVQGIQSRIQAMAYAEDEADDRTLLVMRVGASSEFEVMEPAGTPETQRLD